MSSSSGSLRSSEEETRSTAPASSPPGRIHYDPFRQSVWSGPFGNVAGYTSQRSSPGGSDIQQAQSLFENRGADPRSVGNNIDEPPPLRSLLQSPSASEFSPHFASIRTHGSASGQPVAFGSRPESQEFHGYTTDSFSRSLPAAYENETGSHTSDAGSAILRNRPTRPAYNRDEFDGPSQLLPLPLPQQEQSRAQALPQLAINLSMAEQDEVMRRANDILSHCAFHFIAKYQFPIPLERDKPHVRQALDREWTEWAYLLKRLATKRRIPARVLFDGQIRQLVTTLENSIAVRQTNVRNNPPAPRRPRDDRYMLQLVSAGLQVAKILMDSVAMEQLDQLYIQTEALIMERRSRISSGRSDIRVGRII